MRKLMLRSVWLSVMLLMLMGPVLSAQEAVKSSIPESVKNSLDGLQKTRTANGVFNVQYKNSYFWALEKAVYVNLVLGADLESDVAEIKGLLKKQFDERNALEMKRVEEANKKIRKEAEKRKFEPGTLVYPETFHDLYLRVVKGSLVIQEYRSHVPFDGQATAYYSFGTILAPGEYDILLNINRVDNSKDGTQIFKLQVPELTLQDITRSRLDLQISAPVFYWEVKQMLQPETRFTVVKNKFENGPAQLEFFPCPGNTFKNSDKPTLTFFIMGAVAVQSAEPWNLTAGVEIRSGKTLMTRFEEIKLSNPYFYQPVEFIKKDKDKSIPLPAGDYTLAVELKDNNQSGKAKGTFEIAFKIVD